MKQRLFILGALALTCLLGTPASAYTVNRIGVNTQGNTRGYWEFLPTSYVSNSTQTYPLVIYFHGIGQGGNGTVSSLQTMVGQDAVVDQLTGTSTDIRNLIDSQHGIVLCPQNDTMTWWEKGRLRTFINYALARYPIDRRRIYVTGFSSGSLGIHDFIENDPNADQLTAAFVCGVRGGLTTTGAYIGKVLPYWVLTSAGDVEHRPDVTVNNIAAYIAGTAVPDCMSNFPTSQSASTCTGVFNAGSKTWSWTVGLNSITGVNPKFTLFPKLPATDNPTADAEKNHGHSSGKTYNDTDTWTWAFNQQKPGITLAITPGSTVNAGTSVTLTATITEAGTGNIPGSGIQWFSNLDGPLGSGNNLVKPNLTIGNHVITCTATDTKFRRGKGTATLKVQSTATPFLRVDLGTSTPETGFVKQSTASAPHPTSRGTVTVAVTIPAGGGFYSSGQLSDASPFTYAQLYNDYAFHNNSLPITVALTGAGIAANTQYEVTLYSFDDDYSGSADFSPVSPTTGNSRSVSWTNTQPPTTDDRYAQTLTLTSDSTGKLSFKVDSAGWVVRLCGFKVAAPQPPQGTTLILDNKSAGVSASAGWSLASSVLGYHDTDYLHDNNGGKTTPRTVFFAPSFNAPGKYAVYLRWTAHENRAEHVPVTVYHAGPEGEDPIEVNQRLTGGQWVLLGTYDFVPGSGGVEVSNEGTTGYVIADAVKFEPAP